MEEGESSGGEAGKSEPVLPPQCRPVTLYLQVLLEADGEYLSHGGAEHCCLLQSSCSGGCRLLLPAAGFRVSHRECARLRWEEARLPVVPRCLLFTRTGAAMAETGALPLQSGTTASPSQRPAPSLCMNLA